MRRITGPEPEEKRQSATAAPLILATPTVDIGYNFVKLGKSRQNVDFLLCEARFGDDLLQRLGRAGRVLGKPITDQPSTVLALINENALAQLAPLDGQTLTRAQLHEQIARLDQHLPHKHNLFSYIKQQGIHEVFYPIYQVHRLALLEMQAQLENLYETLCYVFKVSNADSFQKLRGYYVNHYYQQKWLADTKESISHNKETAQQVAKWLNFMGQGQQSTADIVPHLNHPKLLGTPEHESALRYFVASQWHLAQSLFAFRDSFQPATAVCYDRDHLFSSEDINQYSILHVAANYNVHWYEDRAQFTQLHGQTALKGDLYGRLRGYRDPKLNFELGFHARDHLVYADQESFEQQWVCRPTALKGLRLYAKERHGDQAILDARLVSAIQDKFIPIFLLPHQADFNYVGSAIRRLRHSPIYGRDLTVTFDDGSQAKYLAYLGQDAWLAHAELLGVIRFAEKLTASAIIL